MAFSRAIPLSVTLSNSVARTEIAATYPRVLQTAAALTRKGRRAPGVSIYFGRPQRDTACSLLVALRKTV